MYSKRFCVQSTTLHHCFKNGLMLVLVISIFFVSLFSWYWSCFLSTRSWAVFSISGWGLVVYKTALYGHISFVFFCCYYVYDNKLTGWCTVCNMSEFSMTVTECYKYSKKLCFLCVCVCVIIRIQNSITPNLVISYYGRCLTPRIAFRALLLHKYLLAVQVSAQLKRHSLRTSTQNQSQHSLLINIIYSASIYTNSPLFITSRMNTKSSKQCSVHDVN